MDQETEAVVPLEFRSSDSFWDYFESEHWEKLEFVQKTGFIKPPLSEQALFKAVVAMCEEHAKIKQETGRRSTRVRIYVEGDGFEQGEELKEEYLHLFPNKNDHSFAAYSERVEAEIEGKQFAFVIDALTMPPELKAWTHDLLKGMYCSIKIKEISVGHFWSIFYGNYKSTPYGVHSHANLLFSEAAMYFPIQGKKEMLTWTSEYIDKNLDLKEAQDYSAHMSAAMKLSAEPGGAMYWPSDRWHIGASAGGDVSMVLGLRVRADIHFIIDQAWGGGMLDTYIRSRLREVLLSKLIDCWLFPLYIYLLKRSRRAYKRQVCSLPFDPNDLQSSAEQLPKELRKEGKLYRFMFGDNLERALSRIWLSILSSMGVVSFEHVHPAIEFSNELLLTRAQGSIILWRQLDTETIMIGVGMHAHEMPTRFLPLIKCVTNVAYGSQLYVAELLALEKEICGVQFLSELEKFLLFIAESGAFINAGSTIEE